MPFCLAIVIENVKICMVIIIKLNYTYVESTSVLLE